MDREPAVLPREIASYVRQHHGDRAFDVAARVRDENEKLGNFRAADLWGQAASLLWSNQDAAASSERAGNP